MSLKRHFPKFTGFGLMWYQPARTPLAYLIALFVFLAAREPASAQLFQNAASHMFSFDLLEVQPQSFSADSVRLDVYVAVPFRKLSFLFASEKYVADYGIVVQVTDQTTSKMVLDKYQTYSVIEPVSEHDNRESRGLARADAKLMSVMLAQNRDYEVRVAVRDLSSKHETDTVVRLATRSFSPTSPTLSDLLIYRSRSGTHIIPAIGAEVSSVGAEESGLFCELYNAPSESLLGIVSQVSQGKPSGEELARNAMPFQVPSDPMASKRIPVFENFDFSNLWLGHYVLTTYVLPSIADTSLRDQVDLERKSIAHVSRKITVASEQGVPMVAGDVEEAIAQLSLIATGSEWDSLKHAESVKAKRTAIVEFWRRRNPDPHAGSNRQMAVFYRRLQYVTEHFGSGGSGWRSDRGRVYILLGSPTYVDRHPYEVNQKPYEIWDYTDLQVRYYFVDQYMLGDYRLTGMPPPSGRFLWERESY